MKYYYQKEKQQIGPLTLEELRKENIDENTLVWYSGIEKWTPLRKLNELKEMLYQKIETKYFVLEDKQKKGPFNFEHFKTKNLLPNTLVWTKALDTWTKAKDIDELEDFIMPVVPNELNLVDTVVNNTQGKNRNVLGETLANEVEEDEKLDINSAKLYGTKFVDNKGGFFKRPFSYRGRIGRLEYFLSNFIAFIIYFFILFIIESSRNEYHGTYISDTDPEWYTVILILVVYIFFLYFIVVTTAKRCHDVGNSGWFQLIPFYALILLFMPGQDEDNQWGTKT